MKHQTNGKRVLVATGIVIASMLMVGFGIYLFTKFLVRTGVKQFEQFNANLVQQKMELSTFPQSKNIQGLTIQYPEDWITVEHNSSVFLQTSDGAVKGLFEPMEINLAQFFLNKDQFKERLEKRGVTILKENNLSINSTRLYEYVCSYKGVYIVLYVQGYHDEKVLLSTWEFDTRDAYKQYLDLTKQISLQIL